MEKSFLCVKAMNYRTMKEARSCFFMESGKCRAIKNEENSHACPMDASEPSERKKK